MNDLGELPTNELHYWSGYMDAQLSHRTQKTTMRIYSQTTTNLKELVDFYAVAFTKNRHGYYIKIHKRPKLIPHDKDYLRGMLDVFGYSINKRGGLIIYHKMLRQFFGDLHDIVPYEWPACSRTSPHQLRCNLGKKPSQFLLRSLEGLPWNRDNKLWDVIDEPQAAIDSETLTK